MFCRILLLGLSKYTLKKNVEEERMREILPGFQAWARLGLVENTCSRYGFALSSEVVLSTHRWNRRRWDELSVLYSGESLVSCEQCFQGKQEIAGLPEIVKKFVTKTEINEKIV